MSTDTPNEPTPASADEVVQAQSAPDEARTTDDLSTDDATTDDLSTGDATTDDTATTDTATTDTATTDTATTDDMTTDDIVAEASAGEPATDTTSDEAPVAAEPAAAEPAAAEPVAAEPAAAEPVAAEPVAAEPVAAEPVAAGDTPQEPADADEQEPEGSAPVAEESAEPVRPAPPRPPVPSPAALAARIGTARPVAPAATADHSESARFGRVAEDGTVFVRSGTDEIAVGSYPGAGPDEALQYFARKYDELYGMTELLEQRLTGPSELTAKDAAEQLAHLSEQASEPTFVGDLDALRARLESIGVLIDRRREEESAQRAAAKAAALAEREALVVRAEAIAAQDPQRTQWKRSGEELRTLFDEWKSQQRSGARLDKPVEAELWHRFSAARSAFDKARRAHFSELEATQSEAKVAKERLVREAEQLSGSRDWGPTAREFKRLMDRWRAAGRAGRADDDALWARFKAAQDAFFNAKDEVAAAEDQQFRANLAVKEELLAEAEGLLPVRDLEAAKSALRSIQDRWDRAGKVPRADIDRTEKGIRRVEQAVREAEERKWSSSNPEARARAQSLVEQLERAVADLERDVAAAEAKGNDKKAAEARAAIQGRQALLDQARSALTEFS